MDAPRARRAARRCHDAGAALPPGRRRGRAHAHRPRLLRVRAGALHARRAAQAGPDLRRPSRPPGCPAGLPAPAGEGCRPRRGGPQRALAGRAARRPGPRRRHVRAPPHAAGPRPARAALDGLRRARQPVDMPAAGLRSAADLPDAGGRSRVARGARLHAALLRHALDRERLRQRPPRRHAPRRVGALGPGRQLLHPPGADQRNRRGRQGHVLRPRRQVDGQGRHAEEPLEPPAGPQEVDPLGRADLPVHEGRRRRVRLRHRQPRHARLRRQGLH